MILAIWEGTSHRQILDGIEVMQRKQAHRQLLEQLQPGVAATDCQHWRQRIDAYLAQPQAEIEAGGEEFFAELARFTATGLLAKRQSAT